MLLSTALSTARRRRGLLDASGPPSFAATVISRMRRVKILPRLASLAALRCLMLAHLLWPAMDEKTHVEKLELYAPLERGNDARVRARAHGALLACTAMAGRGSSIERGLEKALLLQKLGEHLEANLAVVDFEHALLDSQGQWQQLGEAIAHPGGVSQVRFSGEILAPDASDQQLEQPRQRTIVIGQRNRRLGRNRRYLADDEAISTDAVRMHLKAVTTFGFQVENAQLRNVA